MEKVTVRWEWDETVISTCTYILLADYSTWHHISASSLCWFAELNRPRFKPFFFFSHSSWNKVPSSWSLLWRTKVVEREEHFKILLSKNLLNLSKNFRWHDLEIYSSTHIAVNTNHQFNSVLGNQKVSPIKFHFNKSLHQGWGQKDLLSAFTREISKESHSCFIFYLLLWAATVFKSNPEVFQKFVLGSSSPSPLTPKRQSIPL